MTAPILVTDETVDLRRLSRSIWESSLRPPRRRTVSQCADECRWLSPEYNERARFGPIRWLTDTVPYLREIMDSLGDPEIREVTFVKASQVAGTEGGQNWLLWTILDSPAPTLIVWPMAMELATFIDSTPRRSPAIERFGLSSPLGRRAVSVPASIAEGNGRIHRRASRNHFSIAQARFGRRARCSSARNESATPVSRRRRPRRH